MYQTTKVNIEQVKLNSKNPRVIKDDKYKKLLKSMKEFPEMLEIRPIVVDDDMTILGGNMRFQAAKQLGWNEITILIAKDLTDEQKAEFLIKDNVNFGDWDWSVLETEWELNKLGDWGVVDFFGEPSEADYSILDDEEFEEKDQTNQKIDEMKNGVRKAIQIEFEAADFEGAQELVKLARTKNLYVGGILIDALKNSGLK